MTQLSVSGIIDDISSQAVGLASSADFFYTDLFIRADIIDLIVLLIACSI